METTDLSKMPAEIASAVVKVMAGVTRLAKDKKNVQGGGYLYANVDDFLAMIGPLCAEAGIFILSEEAETEIEETAKSKGDGTNTVLRIRWAFYIVHATGCMFGPVHRTVQVYAAGAQAYGSSQSYALKQFERALFQIPTGDNDDPDGGGKPPLPPRGANNRNNPPPKNRQLPGGKAAPPEQPPPAEKPKTDIAKTWSQMDETEKGKVHSTAMNFIADHAGDLENLRRCWLRVVAINMTGDMLDEVAAKITAAANDAKFAEEVTEHVKAQNAATA